MAGASGYVLKDIRGAELLGAVREVAAGKSLLDPAATARVLERLRDGGAKPDDRLARLTEQERRILELIGEGLTNRAIGERLHLAEKTIKNYVLSLLGKLGMQRRSRPRPSWPGWRPRTADGSAPPRRCSALTRDLRPLPPGRATLAPRPALAASMPSDEQLAVGLLGRTAYGRAATTLRALPFLAHARHIVADGRVLLRMPRSWGYHRMCAGSAVARPW
ncbi:hypothetical protein SVIOM74S_07370 [Streptomyces violarus]